MYEHIGSSSVDWAGKSYQEIKNIGQQDGSVLIIPVGSIEQHGHHLPVSTDTILVDAVAHLGATRVEKDVPIMVTPTIWTGYSPHHMSFGGTFTLEHRTLLSVLEESASSALENGFDAILFLNGHGGNISLIGSAVSTVGTEHPNSQVLGLTYFQLAASFIDEIRDSELGGMSHGGEFETSLMMHLRPDLVSEGDAKYFHEPYEHGGKDLVQGGPLSVYRGFDEYSHTGAIGAPELASTEKGEAIFELLGDEMESILTQIHELNR
ncbi:creatininase family protein [Haladaptatus sp. GCM10025707]|uniref:creatininase family protein n=1 Tax=unclassified Haladaptatus TaxID=2622732 RepID=UPI0023E8F3C5|nr:creatininase family protein [Haladaptatus sp. QDMS2]